MEKILKEKVINILNEELSKGYNSYCISLLERIKNKIIDLKEPLENSFKIEDFEQFKQQFKI